MLLDWGLVYKQLNIQCNEFYVQTHVTPTQVKIQNISKAAESFLTLLPGNVYLLPQR